MGECINASILVEVLYYQFARHTLGKNWGKYLGSLYSFSKLHVNVQLSQKSKSNLAKAIYVRNLSNFVRIVTVLKMDKPKSTNNTEKSCVK